LQSFSGLFPRENEKENTVRYLISFNKKGEIMKKNTLLSSLVLSSVFLAVNSYADATPDVFICAAAEAAACSQDQPCLRGSSQQVGLPLIWKVNIPEKSIMSVREDSEERASAIREAIDTENRLILLGVDDSKPWTLLIDKTNGKMTLTSSTYDTGFVVHGAFEG
jgi:hypothetical protein